MSNQEIIELFATLGITVIPLGDGQYNLRLSTMPGGGVDRQVSVTELQDLTIALGLADPAPGVAALRDPSQPPAFWPPSFSWPPMKTVVININSGEAVTVPDLDVLFGVLAFEREQQAILEGGGTVKPLPFGTERTIVEGGQIFAWDLSLGGYRHVASVPAAAEPVVEYLDTAEEDNWLIERWGYTDPVTGEEVVTKRRHIRSTEDPILSLDQMIGKALGLADDPGNVDDHNVKRAQAYFDFKNQITQRELNFEQAQQRLQTALQIAQSPSDYLTLTALYTGALVRESPARVGERVAPLMPFLQQLAQQFFLDVPGITPVGQGQTADEQEGQAVSSLLDVPGITPVGQGQTAEGSAISPDAPRAAGEPLPGPTEGLGEPLPGSTVGLGELGLPPGYLGLPPGSTEGQGEPPPGFPEGQGEPPPGWIVGQGGRFYNPSTYQWEDPEAFRRRKEGKGKLATGLGSGTGEGPSSLASSINQGLPSFQQVPSFQQGGEVPGPTGQATLGVLHGGETVLPAGRKQRMEFLERSGMLGDVFRPKQQELGTFLTQPATTQIPSLIGGGFRFRSAQTLRRMTPTQQRLYRAGIESFGIPFEDFLQQERLATGAEGRALPSLRFRPTAERVR